MRRSALRPGAVVRHGDDRVRVVALAEARWAGDLPRVEVEREDGARETVQASRLRQAEGVPAEALPPVGEMRTELLARGHRDADAVSAPAVEARYRRNVLGEFVPGDRSEDAPPGASADRPREATDERGRNEMSTTAENTATRARKATAEAKPGPGPLQSVYDAIYAEVKAIKGAKPVKTKGYVRFSVNGKTLVYLHAPSRKSVRVEIPKTGDRGYDDLRVTSEAAAVRALAAVRSRAETVKA